MPIIPSAGEEYHQTVFAPQVAKSNFAVQLVASYMEWKGWPRVDWKLATVASTRKESVKTHADDGDILAYDPCMKFCVVEVKWLGYHFTGLHDWPFRRKDEFLVMPKYHFDLILPEWFVAVNPTMTHMAILDCSTHPKWRERVTTSRLFNHKQGALNYVCSPKLVTAWRAVPPDLWPLRDRLLAQDPRYLNPTL